MRSVEPSHHITQRDALAITVAANSVGVPPIATPFSCTLIFAPETFLTYTKNPLSLMVSPAVVKFCGDPVSKKVFPSSAGVRAVVLATPIVDRVNAEFVTLTPPKDIVEMFAVLIFATFRLTVDTFKVDILAVLIFAILAPIVALCKACAVRSVMPDMYTLPVVAE